MITSLKKEYLDVAASVPYRGLEYKTRAQFGYMEESTGKMSPSFPLSGCFVLAFLVDLSIGQYDQFLLNPVASDTGCPEFPNPFFQCYRPMQPVEIQNRRAQQNGKYTHFILELIVC